MLGNKEGKKGRKKEVLFTPFSFIAWKLTIFLDERSYGKRLFQNCVTANMTYWQRQSWNGHGDRIRYDMGIGI